MKKLSIKTKIFGLVVVLFLAVFATIKITSAWLTDTASSESTTINVGLVDYTMTLSGTNLPEKVVPGQILLGESGNNKGYTLTITNASTVKSQFRISELKATVTKKGGSAETIDLLTQTDEAVKLTINSNEKWFKSSDNMLYYGNSSDTTAAIETSVSSLEASYLIVTLDGAAAGNEYAEATITIKVVFQAKQADYVEWSTESLTFQTK